MNTNTTIPTDINNLKDTDDARFLLTDAIFDDGWFRRYWENGNIRYEWEYKNGKRADGVSRGWFDNGNIKNEYSWKDGQEWGYHIEWWKNGNKKHETTYNETSQTDGLDTWWYENGEKSSEGNYKDGLLINSWDVDGNVMVEDGDGVWTYWYENGQKKKEVTFENGKKNGKMTVWDIDRSILNEVFFINNKKVELNHL